MNIENYSDFLNNAQYCIHIVSAEGIIMWANKYELDFLGYTEEEYFNKPITNFHNESTKINDILNRLTSEETLKNYEATLIHKSGRIIPVSICSNMYKKNNHVIHTRCFTSDLTQAKILELENKNISQFSNILSNIISNNYDMHNLCYNITKELIIFTGCKYGYFAEVKYKDNLPHLWANIYIDTLGKNLYENTLKKNPDGIYFPITDKEKIWTRSYFEEKSIIDNKIDNLPIRNCPITQITNYYSKQLRFKGDIVGVIALAGKEIDFDDAFCKTYKPIMNIISNIIWSRKLLKKNELVQSKLEQEKAITKIKLEEQNYYISQISHELKTPLNSILGFTQLLKLKNNPDINEYLNYILENGNNLMELINESLSLNRLDFFTVNKEYNNLFENINNCLLNNKSIMKPNTVINIDINKGYYIYTDKKLLINILNNLITNAYKYTTKTISINCNIKNSKLYLNICNSGNLLIKMDNIFKPFEKHTESTGHGLGVSIIKRILDTLDETIECTSSNNIVTFSLSFPYVQKKEKEAYKIVYLEDNKFNQILMKEILKGCNLTIKDNAHDFLSYIRDYDLLLLDMNLNHINGKDVIKILKNEEINISVIIVTADTTNIISQYFKEENLKYFNKPINIEEFRKYLGKTYGLFDTTN